MRVIVPQAESRNSRMVVDCSFAKLSEYLSSIPLILSMPGMNASRGVGEWPVN